MSEEDSKRENKKFLLQNAWRKSYSLREKAKLKNLEKDGGCRKRVLRFLKGLTHTDHALKGLTSYDWKNMLFHLNEKDLPWENEDFVERVFYMIRLMAYFVKNKDLPMYYRPDKINLFRDMDEKTQYRVYTRLMSLYSNEKKFDKKFKSTTDENKKDSANQQMDGVTQQMDEPIDNMTHEMEGSVEPVSNTIQPVNSYDTNQNGDNDQDGENNDDDNSGGDDGENRDDEENDDDDLQYENSSAGDDDNDDYYDHYYDHDSCDSFSYGGLNEEDSDYDDYY